MYQIPQQVSTKYALYLNKDVIVFDDNLLPERNLFSIVSDSAQHWSTFRFFQDSY